MRVGASLAGLHHDPAVMQIGHAEYSTIQEGLSSVVGPVVIAIAVNEALEGIKRVGHGTQGGHEAISGDRIGRGAPGLWKIGPGVVVVGTIHPVDPDVVGCEPVGSELLVHIERIEDSGIIKLAAEGEDVGVTGDVFLKPL